MAPLKGHIAEISIRKGDTPAEVLSVTNTGGFVRSLDVFDKQVFSQDARNYKLVLFNDLAYNPSRINVGSIARCEFSEGGAVSPMYVVVRCRPSLLPQFLLHFLKSDIGKLHIAHRCVGAVRFMLRFGDLEQIELLLPPVAEQERIVRILDEIEMLRHLGNLADQRTECVISSSFVHTFGQPTTNPFNWPVMTLRQVLAVPLRNGVSPATEGTITDKVLTLSAITGVHFDASAVKEAEFARLPVSSKRVKEGQYLICRGNGNINLVGAGNFASPESFGCVFPDTMISAEFDPTVVENEFMDALWRTPHIRSQIQSSARTTNGTHKINQESLELVSFPVPPLGQQRAFTTTVKETRVLQDAQTASRRRLSDLSQSLSQRAFQGEL